MKSLIILGLCTVSVLTSCAKPPQFGGSKKKNNSIQGEPAPGTGPGPFDKVNPNPPDYANLVCNDAATHRGLRNWRRLSQIEMINTAKDVFQLPADKNFDEIINDIPKKVPFDTVASPETNMDINRMKGYVRFAESVSAAVDLAKFFPCMAEKEACVQKKAGEIASLAWRRPADANEIASLTSLFKGMSGDGVLPEAAFRHVIQAIILSPSFMYRTELGKKMSGVEEYELTSWEIASALSYMITRRPPDAELRDAATRDALKDPAAISAQVDRLFELSGAKDGMRDFASLWFSSDRITNVEKKTPEFTDDVKLKLKEEMEDHFVHTMFEAETPTYKQLLSSDYSVGDRSVGFIYASQPDATGKLKFSQNGRRGLLGLGGFLAAYVFGDVPNPVTRGVFISERLLCTEFAMPPAVKIPEAKPGQSNRERFAMHSTNPACASCHATIDGLGFATDNFGSNGEFRTMDGNIAIAINQKVEIDGGMAQLAKPEDLSMTIANSTQGANCYARQVFRYAFGRMEYAKHKVLGLEVPFQETAQTKLDTCQVDSAVKAMNEKGGDLKSVFVSYVTSPAFRLRVAHKEDANKMMLLQDGPAKASH